VGVLTWRALDGLALERAIRHQTVSDRTFEEMERALSRFLEREEERPFEEYRYYLGDSGRRSPLARGSAEDFVVGGFQIDPDGSVHTPLRPRGRGGGAGGRRLPADGRRCRDRSTRPFGW